MMWLIYSAINVSLLLVGSWLLFGLIQGIVAGLLFQKMNA
jgi:flagellar biosynthesis protein FliQ